MHGSTNPQKPGTAGSEDGSRTIERPKLNLKPRTHPIEQSDGNTDKARSGITTNVNLLCSSFSFFWSHLQSSIMIKFSPR